VSAPPEASIDRLPLISPSLRRAALRFGTPAYVTDLAEVAAAVGALTASFPDPWLRAFSLKANDVGGVVSEIEQLGLDANVVSRGEWAIATRAGFANDRITFEGVGKTDADLRAAVAASAAGRPLRWLAVESLDEVEVLVALASRGSLDGASPLELLFRLNPEVAPETHAGLAVGSSASKFGMTADELSSAVQRVASVPGLVARGVHLHVGSQLRAVDAWRDAVRRGLAVLALLRGSLDSFDTLDVGGGFPIVPLSDGAPTPARFAQELGPLIEAIPPDRRPRRFAIEPGRFVVARAGYLVARVLHVRERDGRQIVLDAGMTELIRPALYGAHHDVVALTSLGKPLAINLATGAPTPSGLEPARLEGPICESTDHLGDHLLPPLRRGDLVVIRDAGGYGASLASTYNGRPRPPQLLLAADGSIRVGRRRGSLASLG
jgi:diaminopimelate decarboxylase